MSHTVRFTGGAVKVPGAGLAAITAPSAARLQPPVAVVTWVTVPVSPALFSASAAADWDCPTTLGPIAARARWTLTRAR
jgi:hypothetical protein